MEKAKTICSNFIINEEVRKITVLTSGHINDTYLIETDGQMQYVLQRINDFVFNDPKTLVRNKVHVSQHLNEIPSAYKALQFVKTKTGEYFHEDDSRLFWNMMVYLKDSKTYIIPSSSALVYEAGKLYGDFIQRMDSFPVNKIAETISMFHSVPHRNSQFEDSLINTSEELLAKAHDEIYYARSVKEEMFELEQAREQGKYPIRVLHNDTKISNVLFDENDLGLAVIDFDTVMPGIVHYDFGDAVRSMCSNRREDDPDVEGLSFRLDYFEAFCKGYGELTTNILTSAEKGDFTLGVKVMIYIMGIRFLTDYLNKNIYYKVDYETHNLIRAKNQFRLLKSVYSKEKEIVSIIESYFLK
ncbi:MAG: Ser/Thr protein kinase RdoA (MazF antagonist) [Flavobacteriales bacterium]|jgi:Ser/Thr protein kinase RdoA (MazF antagonist)